MLKGAFHCDPLRRLQLHHLRQQVNRLWLACKLVAPFDEVLIPVNSPLWKRHFHFWKLFGSLPIRLFWCTQNLKDLKELSDLAFSSE